MLEKQTSSFASGALGWKGRRIHTCLRIGKGRMCLGAAPSATLSKLSLREPVERRGCTFLLTRKATRCTTCWGSLSRITLQTQRRSLLACPVPKAGITGWPSHVTWNRGSHFPFPLQIQAGQRTHPPSTISSTAKKSPSMFSSRALFSTFFLNPQKRKIRLCVKGILGHYLNIKKGIPNSQLLAPGLTTQNAAGGEYSLVWSGCGRWEG